MKTRLWLPNFDRFFRHDPEGRVARKCLKLVWRSLFLLSPGDGIVVGKTLPDEDFLDYFQRKMGFTPIIIQAPPPPDGPLNFLAHLLGQRETLSQIQTHGQARNWSLAPLISHPLVHEMGRATRLPTLWTTETLVRTGLAQELNDKALFRQTCTDLAIPTDAGQTLCFEPTDVAKATRAILASGGKAVVREAISAGGLGNSLFHNSDQFEKSYALVNGQGHPWHYCTLVAPYREHTPVAVAMEVTEQGTNLIACNCRLLEGLESVGCRIPGPWTQGMYLTTQYALTYGRWLFLRGYRGPVDIDFGILPNGQVLAFESNARVLLTTVPLNIRTHYQSFWKTDRVHLIYDEAPPLNGLGLDQILSMVDKAMGEHKKNQVDIVITSPPDPDERGWFSFAVLSTQADLAEQVRTTFRSFLKETSTA